MVRLSIGSLLLRLGEPSYIGRFRQISSVAKKRVRRVGRSRSQPPVERLLVLRRRGRSVSTVKSRYLL